MKEFVDVNTGQVAVHRGNFMLRAMAMGSCIAVTAYDTSTRIAAMAHVMLPGTAPQNSSQKTKYAANALQQMIDQMLRRQANINDIEVCLVGAGNVLQKKKMIPSATTTLSPLPTFWQRRTSR